MASVKVVCPSADSLNAVETDIKCTFAGCESTFTSKSHLNMHIVKHHKRLALDKNEKDTEYRYHCPDETCVYNVKSSKHFTHMRYLKQHFLKVHASKSFICEKCNKGFSTLASKNSHRRICGISFCCSVCNCFYASYEALLTHSKRKNHKILQKSQFLKNNSDKLSHIVAPRPSNVKLTKNCFILPKTSNSPIIILDISKSFREIGIQTDCDNSQNVKKQTISSKTSCSQKSFPNKMKQIRKTTETQTNGDCILRQALQKAKILQPEKKRKQCIKTQNTVNKRKITVNLKNKISSQAGSPKTVKNNSLEEKSSPNSLEIAQETYNQKVFPTQTNELRTDEIKENTRLEQPYIRLSDVWNNSDTQASPIMNKNIGLEFLDSDRQFLNCGSQTNLNHLNYFNEDSFIDQTYPNRNGMDGLIGNRKFYDAGRLCSIETQTELNNYFVDDNSSFDRMLQSNMCTQTCNNILLSDLGFNDIETQTAWPKYRDDILVSTETQTSFFTAELNHTETQTDLAIRKLTDFSCYL